MPLLVGAVDRLSRSGSIEYFGQKCPMCVETRPLLSREKKRKREREKKQKISSTLEMFGGMFVRRYGISLEKFVSICDTC